MSDYPLVSVVIPTYNGAHLVTKAIESVKAQTYPNVEIIVSDDQSSDNLDEVMQRYADDPAVHYVKHSHTGLPENRNIGVRKAQGEFIAFLDQDDIYQPDYLQRAYDRMQTDREIGLVYTGYNEVDTRSGDTQYFDAHLSGHVFEQMIRGCNIAPSTVMMRRSVFDTVGFFNPNYQFGDDVDMWIRVSQHYALAGIDEPLVTRRKHGDNMTANHYKLFNRQMYLWKKLHETYPQITRAEHLKRMRGEYHHMLLRLYQTWPDFVPGYNRRRILQHVLVFLYYVPIFIVTPLVWGTLFRLIVPMGIYDRLQPLWRKILKIEAKP